MKQLEKAKDIYLKEYEVNVTPCLTMVQVESIIKGVCAIETNDFAERKMNEDMLLLYYVTDIGEDALQETSYEDLVNSGLIATVRSHVKNISLIQEGLTYAESLARSLVMLAPKIMPLIEKFGELNGYKENLIKK